MAPHTSSLWASYGMSLMMDTKKNDPYISGVHCIGYQDSSSSNDYSGLFHSPSKWAQADPTAALQWYQRNATHCSTVPTKLRLWNSVQHSSDTILVQQGPILSDLHQG